MNNNITTKINSFILALVLCCISCNILSLKCEAVTPRWTSIFSIDLAMSFDGSDGNVSGLASKQSTATKIEGTLYLYELIDDEWVYIDEWYNSKTRGSLGISGDFVCESGVTYKAVFIVTAYTGNNPETETVEYIDECP